jgi:ABC-type glycerol-3-phosphate transport system substrate-binding protein
LRLWLPPHFDPAADTQAGKLLRARLDEFTGQHPGVRIEVRVKALEGSGGLIDSLMAANAAAPQAMPDLIALSRPALEVAALKGLLHPYDGLTAALDAPDWYDFARQLSRLQNSTFGLPFAGDALLLTYRPARIGRPPPADWEATLAISQTLVFPAADSQALFTLTLYQASGGALQDPQGRPMLDVAILDQVLSFYVRGGQTGLLPNWLTLYETDDQAWNAYTQGQANLSITWASRYLRERPTGSAAAPLPTPDGNAFTLATGWVWALAGAHPEQQTLSVELAEFLIAKDFLAEWSAAAGYIPPRSEALAQWDDAGLRALLEHIASSAHLRPPADILTALGSSLEQATVQVLKQQTAPLAAAQEAANRLNP